MPSDFCIVPLILMIGLIFTTLFFAHSSLRAYRSARLWMNTAQQMHRAAAHALPINDPLELRLAAMYEAAKVDIEPEARL